jgi:hypothetical protein
MSNFLLPVPVSHEHFGYFPKPTGQAGHKNHKTPRFKFGQNNSICYLIIELKSGLFQNLFSEPEF